MGFTEILLLLITSTLVIKGPTNAAKTNETFILPLNCPKVCGNISIEYPFGIGNGCFYAAGFNLTCSYAFNPPRLFLWDGTIQVVGFDMKLTLIQIESPYVILDAHTESINSTLINVMNSPFSLYGQRESLYVRGNSSAIINNNYLYVVGCNATANIVDLSTNNTLAFCSPICSTNTSLVDNGDMSGNGYCIISLSDLTFSQIFSLTIKLSRPSENKNNHMITSGSSNIIAVLCNECSSPINQEDLQSFIKQENKTSAKAHLTWRINDSPSCEEARNYSASYACRSRNSDCYNIPADYKSYHSNDTIGYICQCSFEFRGNPYLPDGCQLDTNFTRIPAKDCPDTCGNITVSFPFGLKENCYRSQEFALSCNMTSHPPTLLYGGYLEVKAISLEDGQLELSPQVLAYESEFEKYFPSSEELNIYNWIVGYETCDIAMKNKSTYACLAQHSSCLDAKFTNEYENSTYRCKCMEGYEGNPYIQDGCQDINECNSSSHGCKGICVNTDGSFNCTCPPGTSQDPVQGACIPQRKKILLFGVLIGVSIGIGLLLLCITLIILSKKWKERNQKKIRQRNFHQNHGLLLQQLISTNDCVERTNIFSLEEIEKATNNFDETLIVGKGGHGTVYKGILSDQSVVAIKKSKMVKKSEIDQFINEVVVLSQINHRNVVKLFGCCLETEVPLVIYEFISNGALSDHLHILQGGTKLSWDDRLRIATESAGALAYLHSAASISILHRDIKSSNILLDDTFKAKISDFGVSRFIPLDQTHIVTAIHGTFGYLDPEYYQTGQLTEKSDVYSFGVILLELLTGKKPIYSIKTGSQQNLAINFLQTTREKMLFDLIEDHILQEGTEQELLEITTLIEMCLSLKGVERPTMKEVEYRLQGIRKTRTKKKGLYSLESNEETERLLTLSCHSPSELVNQINQENSRNYSLEKEFMQSQNYPRTMGFTKILLLLIISTLVIKGSTNSANTNENFILPSNCPKVCGNISIEYPFGIGNGCFYAAGFNLTCSYDFNPPRLFLSDGTIQVMDFDMNWGLIIIESPYVILDANTESINTTLINLTNLPFSISSQSYVYGDDSFSGAIASGNSLYVGGCSANASIVDLITDIIVASCPSICSSTIDSRFTTQNGYCRISLDFLKFNTTTLNLQLSRPNENENNHTINSTGRSSIISILCSGWNCPSNKGEFQSFIKREDKTRASASLSWHMSDRSSCKEARSSLATNACRSRNSDCYNIPAPDSIYSNDAIGYICQCSLGYYGNPYLPDGCQLDTNFTSVPAKDCPEKCGNMTIPFPFGLKEKCYRSKEFALSCNESTQPPTLFNLKYLEVKAISLEDGKLELSPHDEAYSSEDEYITSLKRQTIYNWIVGYQTCVDAMKNKSTFACFARHSSCLDMSIARHQKGYRCKCMEGYEGNPYIHNGCRDIDECKSSSNVCKGICVNTEGSFNCTCPSGTSEDPLHGACIPNKKKILLLGVLVGASIGIGLLLFCIKLFILSRKWKERNQKKIRQRNFHKNHGLLLQQLISTNERVEERTNIFSLEEIEKATNNFDDARIIGKGGHGIVYKGILSDQRVVAIKKSKTVKKSEIDQFINEVAILSQINHRNIVKLFGCCLETEVPLLIYEFISNGALSDHLHVLQGEIKLSWDDRLRIATESAGALAYLHSAASTSIFHRDVKSSNILLDDTLRAKVSDFGASRFIPLNQTHIVTVIHGTFGYLDPEYYQTGKLTEKSDVYSFGVILLELLTGKKPIYSTETGSQQNLAMYFLQTIREKMFFNLIEDCILQEGTEQELVEINNLIEMCLSLKGTNRPTMKEVEDKLQGMRKTRIKKRGLCIPEGNEEEIESLLTLSSYSSSANQIN